MNLRWKRPAAGLLALLFFLLSGCAGKGGTPAARAMGRYVETEIDLPADFYSILGLHTAEDGSLELLGFPNPAAGEGKVYLTGYRSTDEGATWTEACPVWADDFNQDENPFSPESAAWGPDGTLYLFLNSYENDTVQELFAKIENDAVVFLDGEIPASSSGAGVSAFQVAENGDFVLDCWSEFIQMDPATGTVKHVYTAPDSNGGSWNDGWAVTGNTLAVSDAAYITTYDLTTGKALESIPFPGGVFDVYGSDQYRIMAYDSNGVLCFADPKGLYRATEGSDTLEQLADGSLTSLSMPSIVRRQLLVLEDGRYLALCWSDRNWLLFSYAYDPDVPTLPDTELNVWSLKEDPLIVQAINAFQKADAGVHVNYQIGLPEDGSVTRDDAIRALNTQLLAGKGPDVLILDGLPVDSYLQKNVLTDLSAQLETLRTSGGLLDNIIEAYRQADGTLPAVPSQFQVPMLHGSDDAMGAIHDLSSMTDWLEANKGGYRSPFLFDQAQNYLRFFYPPCAASLEGTGGSIDPEKLSDFLSLLKRIADLRTDPDAAEEDNDYTPEFDFGPLGWTAGFNALNAGNLIHFQGLYAAWTASNNQGDGYTDTLFGGNGYLPVTVLGVSAQSKQQELSWRFIEAVLSDKVQLKAVGRGLPVSAAAFYDSTLDTNSYNDGTFSTYGTTFFDADGAMVPVNMRVKYPPEEYRQEMAERLKALDEPLFYDQTVLELLIDGTKDFFAGASGLDATVTALLEKLTLYQAEQQ